LISIVGSSIGTMFGTLSFFVLFAVIDNVSKVPVALPTVKENILTCVLVFLFAAGLGPICSSLSIAKVCPKEILK